ncbi:unnamed protein product [Brassica oleracea var. botrytis]|uniref:Uncharacterized protein n=1 Tax=Brassica oleracea TaxID=3712 RepID=A0A3P6G0W7_BRAOL|nr:unnamed protein product [Brassica oleracea]
MGPHPLISLDPEQVEEHNNAARMAMARKVHSLSGNYNKSFDEFWPLCMMQHSNPSTRRWHFMGIIASIVALLCSILAALGGVWFGYPFYFFSLRSAFGTLIH